jgi:hypothetical protein
MMEGCRKLHNEYSLPSIIRVIKSRRMYVAWMGEKGHASRILVEKRPIGRLKHRWVKILDGMWWYGLD